jgi:hypothetical protein
MNTYHDHHGNSGVSAYNIGPNFIIVQFKSGERYLYNYVTPGRKQVEAMKKLATRNEGLSTYISQHVRDHYAAKLSHAA